MTYKLLILEGMTERGQAVLDAEGWTLDSKKAMPPSELAKIIGDYDAVTIRSGTKFTAEVVAAAKKLRVIGRPGVGVDNVDVEAATRAGIFVMNSPGGNLVSTCELTMALLLATSRNIAAADASLKAGTWDRKAFAGGAEISGKRIGVVGFGRIGREVAARCKAFGMEVWAFDPFVSSQVAEKVGAKAVTLDEILTGCDYITLHTVMTPDTRHMLGKEAFAKIKPGVRIINAARGELIDEEALYEALESGRVAGCGLDVHAKEPPVDWKIAKHPKVVATPHIGAQTVEAQDRVGTDIAYQVRDFLKDGVIQQAVNFFQLSGEAYDQIKPAIDLGERLASFAAQVAKGEVRKVAVTLYGGFKDLQPQPIVQAAVAGALKAQDPEITFVNAMARAESRGVETSHAVSSSTTRHANLMGVRVTTSEVDLAVAGTLFGEGQLRLVEIDGISVDAVLHGHILAIKNDDTPGVVGRIGTKLGENGINIAQMNLGRKAAGGRAVMLIEVDSDAPKDVLGGLMKIDGVREARAISLA
jgi:D-3-phosphoglycerate dehydrogenase / 2-oxoglutarate reductase